MMAPILLRSLQRIERTVLLQILHRNVSLSTTYSMADHMTITAENTRHSITANAIVAEIKDLSKTVKLLKLKVKEDTFSFKAGQWIDMFIPEVGTIGGFSMCSAPGLLTSSRVFHLSVKCSKHPPAYWVHTKCQIGDSVLVRAGGDFFYDPQISDAPSDILLLAGGVGINPLYSILLHFVTLSAENSLVTKNRKATLLYSAKTVDELLFKEELIQIEETNPSVTVKLHSTKGENSLINGITGYIGRSHVEEALSTFDKSQTDIYICGPSSFINVMVSSCCDLVQKHRIHYEKWW